MKNYADCTHQNEPPKPEGFVDRYAWYITHELCKICALDTAEVITILDVGCGNGEYCDAWKKLGFNARGIDKDSKYDEDYDFTIYGTINEFSWDCDIVHSKSFIEHVYNVEYCISEMYEALKDNGICIMLTPDIEYSKWTFYSDFGHHSPFTADSLYQILDWADFKNIHVERFYKGLFDARWKRPLKGMLIGWGTK